MEELDRGDLLVRGAGLLLASGGLAGLLDDDGLAAGTADSLRDLGRSLRGTVVLRADSAYATARLPYNTRYDGVRPLAVVFVESAADVTHTLAWARRHGVRVVARSGGHSYGGYSTTRGLVIDVSRLHAVRVDAARRLVTVGAGARLIDVYAALDRHGLTIPAGSCPTVGLAGLALGGGVGFASRKFGLTCDNVRELTIVTADGRVRTCNARRNADLFWACRGGGGGSFGIVTRFVLRAHRVGRVATFRVSWPWADAAHAVAAWQKWAPGAPDELFSVLQLAAPGGRPVVAAAGQLMGSETQLRALLAPLTGAGTPTSVSVRSRSYWEATLMWAGCSDLGMCHARGRATFAAKSQYAKRRFTGRGIDALVGAVEQRASAGIRGRGSILLDSYGGAIRRVPRAATAFAHRDALFSLQYLAYWESSAQRNANLAWLRRAHAAMRPHVSAGAYLNYIDPELRDWRRGYYGANLPRLRRVKRRYDPRNVFRFAQSVPP